MPRERGDAKPLIGQFARPSSTRETIAGRNRQNAAITAKFGRRHRKETPGKKTTTAAALLALGGAVEAACDTYLVGGTWLLIVNIDTACVMEASRSGGEAADRPLEHDRTTTADGPARPPAAGASG